MNILDIRKASELADKLEVAQRSLKGLENALFESTYAEYWSTLSKHKDGSGWSVCLHGVVPATDVIKAVKDLVEKRVSYLSEEIEKL